MKVRNLEYMELSDLIPEEFENGILNFLYEGDPEFWVTRDLIWMVLVDADDILCNVEGIEEQLDYRPEGWEVFKQNLRSIPGRTFIDISDEH